MTETRILIVEDNPTIHQLLRDILAKHSPYNCESAYSGTEARRLLQQQSFQLILLDLMLPGLTGEQLLQEAKRYHKGGIIILSAKSDIEDKVQLLQLGADDYLTKPFHQLELLARIESVLRRYQPANSEVASNHQVNYTYRQLHIATDEMIAYFGEHPLHLTATEFEILHQLIKAPRKVFSREKLYQLIWGESTFIEDNAINVHVSNLRKKIAKYTDEPYIETVWGIGFKLKG